MLKPRNLQNEPNGYSESIKNKQSKGSTALLKSIQALGKKSVGLKILKQISTEKDQPIRKEPLELTEINSS